MTLTTHSQTTKFSYIHLLKAFYLHILYLNSIKYYATIPNFNDIESLSLVEANRPLGLYSNLSDNQYLSAIKDVKTFLEWFWSYREKDSFPNVAKLCNKSQLPPFLSQHPDALKDILDFCNDNIAS